MMVSFVESHKESFVELLYPTWLQFMIKVKKTTYKNKKKQFRMCC